MAKQYKKAPARKYFGASIKAIPQFAVHNMVQERLVRAFIGVQQINIPTPSVIPLWMQQHQEPHFVLLQVGTWHRGFDEQMLDPSIVAQCALEGYSARRILNVLNQLVLKAGDGEYPALAIDPTYDEVVVPIYTTLAGIMTAVRIVQTDEDIKNGIFVYPEDTICEE